VPEERVGSDDWLDGINVTYAFMLWLRVRATNFVYAFLRNEPNYQRAKCANPIPN